MTRRDGQAMAYDSARHVVVMFGGSASSPGNYTWEYDGTTWQVRATTGPPWRRDAAMAYDRSRGHVVLFGGWDDRWGLGTFYGDTWEWDGNQWTQRTVTGPPPAWGPAMTYDTA